MVMDMFSKIGHLKDPVDDARSPPVKMVWEGCGNVE